MAGPGAGIEADEDRCNLLIERSLAMCTALAPPIGYDAAAAVAKKAFASGRTVREVALELAGKAPEQAAASLGVPLKGEVPTAEESHACSTRTARRSAARAWEARPGVERPRVGTMFRRCLPPQTFPRRRLRPWVRGLGPPVLIICGARRIIAYRTQNPDWRGPRPR